MKLNEAQADATLAFVRVVHEGDLQRRLAQQLTQVEIDAFEKWLVAFEVDATPMRTIGEASRRCPLCETTVDPDGYCSDPGCTNVGKTVDKSEQLFVDRQMM